MPKQHAKASSSEDELYEVEDIVAQRCTDEGMEYLVKWKGYSASQNTWEPLCNLGQAQQVLKAFELRQRSDPVPDSTQRRKRLRTMTPPDSPVPTPKTKSTYRDEDSAEEYDSSPPRKPSKRKGSLEILSVRADRSGDLIWTVRNTEGERMDMDLERVKRKAPIALIDFLVSKLRFA